MTVLIAIPALLVSQGHNLERIYKENDVDRYSVSVTLTESSGQVIEASAEVVSTVKRILERGKAEIARKMEKLVFKIDGMLQDIPQADQRLDHFDKHGMPDSMEVDGPEVLYVIAAFSAFAPHAEVAVGSSYDIKWKAQDDTVSINGKGTLTEIVEIDGAKYAKLKSTATVTPQNDTEGVVTWTSTLSLVDGKLLKADGKVEIEDTTISFKAERVTKKDG